ncbi:hypothetical protein Peur_024642 [Populus x canadensis]
MLFHGIREYCFLVWERDSRLWFRTRHEVELDCFFTQSILLHIAELFYALSKCLSLACGDVKGNKSKHHVVLWLGHSQAWPKASLGPGRAGPKIELNPGHGETMHHVALGQYLPKPAAQRHLELGLLPLGCSQSATWCLGCLYF